MSFVYIAASPPLVEASHVQAWSYAAVRFAVLGLWCGLDAPRPESAIQSVSLNGKVLGTSDSSFKFYICDGCKKFDVAGFSLT